MEKYFYKKKEKNRINITDMPFITIDGNDSKDFDDAIYTKKLQNENYLMFICISDVSYYVNENSYLDKKAYEICNSIYLPQKAIPMFPDFLSNDLCSLKPNLNRLSMLCEILINKKGKIIKYEFHKTIIKSRMDFNYNEINNIIVYKKEYLNKSYLNLMKLIKNLYKLNKMLIIKRRKNHNINFFKEEKQILFSKSGDIYDIKKMKKKISYSLIEEFMIYTNLFVCKFLNKNQIHSIYRNHIPPFKKKSILINKFINLINKKVNKKLIKFFNIKFYLKIIDSINKKPLFFVFQNILLNAFEKAIYNNKTTGHFGLNVNLYTHFTSPIRRYSDLIVHRIIKHYLMYNKNKYNKTFLNIIGRNCSLYEVKTEKISKTIRFNIISTYLIKNIQNIYIAQILDINKYGFIITINNIGMYGLISNFHINKKDNNFIYRINDEIKVKLLYINEIKEILNFYIEK